MENIDHERAAAAFQSVASRFSAWKKKEEARPFRSVTLSAAGMLRQVGLLQLLAFWGSKKGEEKLVLADLVGWLVRSRVTAGICAAGKDRPAVDAGETANPLGALVARTSAELAILEAEARSYLLWHKRFTEGHWIRLKETSSGEDNRGNANA